MHISTFEQFSSHFISYLCLVKSALILTFLFARAPATAQTTSSRTPHIPATAAGDKPESGAAKERQTLLLESRVVVKMT